VKRFEATGTRDNETAKRILLTTLGKTNFSATEKDLADQFTVAVNKARSNTELQEVLDDPKFTTVVEKLKNN
jgi:uncharacterized protein YktB (UPF0637 family)